MSFKLANERKANELLSIGIWAWLTIVEKEQDKLTKEGQAALGLLREDLERVAEYGGAE